jgi:alcohol dehydrogenase class IV
MQTSFYFDGRMNNFFSPNKIMLGAGATRMIGAEATALGARKVIIVTDSGVVTTGMVAEIEKSLLLKGVDVVVYDKVEIETPARVIDDCARIARNEKCDAVIGLGGGTTLDTTKGVSLMAVNQGSVIDYEGFDRVPLKGLPKIMIPTTAGSGSEVTRVFAITDEADKTKKVVYTIHNLAEVVILDPLLTLSLPSGLTAETGLDVLAHAIEAYTSLNATPFSDMLASEAMRLVGKSLLAAYAKGENLEARLDMLYAATIAGLAFSSSGLGAIHALSFVLENYGMGHARSVSVMMPHVMDYNKVAAAEKYRAVAGFLGEDVAGLSAYRGANLAVFEVERLLEEMHISCKLRDYGISSEDVPAMVANTMKQSRLFVPNARSMTEKDVADIYIRSL